MFVYYLNIFPDDDSVFLLDTNLLLEFKLKFKIKGFIVPNSSSAIYRLGDLKEIT